MNYSIVSVIMPIRNEATYIEATLRSIIEQDYPAELLEIIVADGMSTDKTREIIQSFQVKQVKHHNLELIENPGRIVPTGFNAALKCAKGDVIIRVDGHCVLDPGYVRRCVELLEETGADNVGGLQTAVGEGLVAQAISMATGSIFGVGGARFHYASKPGWVDTVYLGAYHRSVFNRIGLFDEELVRNQDDEFNFRLLQAGGKIWLDPSIKVIYFSRSSFKALWRQYFQYGFYKVRVIQKRGAVPSWRHLIPATFVSGLIISFVLAWVTGNPLWALVISGPYVAANLFASLWTARRDWRTLSLLPLAFLTLHLAYGFGFLQGLWHWRRHWGDASSHGASEAEGQ